MSEEWVIFCEEAGDKEFPWKVGSSHYYVVSAILVREKDVARFESIIEEYKFKVLRMNAPLEWKKLKPRQKKDDKLLSRFLRKVEAGGVEFLVTQVICDKKEITSDNFKNKIIFMNYLYGLIFKRIASFLKTTNAHAKLIIDRNTDKITQDSLRNYLSDVSKYWTGTHPKFSKPKWRNPEDHPILGLTDFVSGLALRSLEDYLSNVNETCKTCQTLYGLYQCETSNFIYKKSYKLIIDWNYNYELEAWSWKGLMYHPYAKRLNYKHLFFPN